MGYHGDDKKHSCDKYGHNLRVFAGGQFIGNGGVKYPSL